MSPGRIVFICVLIGKKNKSNRNVSRWVFGLSFLCYQKADLKNCSTSNLWAAEFKSFFPHLVLLSTYFSVAFVSRIQEWREKSFISFLGSKIWNEERNEKFSQAKSFYISFGKLLKVFLIYICMLIGKHIFHVCPTINDDKWQMYLVRAMKITMLPFCAPSMFDDNLLPINQMQGIVFPSPSWPPCIWKIMSTFDVFFPGNNHLVKCFYKY